MTDKIDNYMKDGGYLPDFMKDFNDQKDVFKAIFEQYKDGNDSELLGRLSWVDAHCFTIDVFLWWMARHGYKLQKIRSNDIVFFEPQETISHFKEIRTSKSILNFIGK